MDEKLREVFDSAYENISPSWSRDTIASEFAQYAIEAFATDLPDVDAETFNSELEGAYNFYRGEALAYLKEREGG